MNDLSLSGRQTKSPFFAADQVERRLWLYWVIVTTLGLIVVPLSNSWTTVLLGTAIVTIGQWFLLRPRIPNSIWWLVVTPVGLNLGIMIGGGIAGVVQDRLDGIATSPVGTAPLNEPGRSFPTLLLANVIGGLLAGTVLGVGQWLVLRRVYSATGWILANIISLVGLIVLTGGGLVVSYITNAIGVLLNFFLFGLVSPRYFSSIVAAAWVGVVTATALLWCLRKPKTVPQTTSARPT